MKVGFSHFAAAAFVFAAIFPPASAQAAEETTIADALDKLQLTPQQLVSLREFFGQFGRDDKVFGTTSGDGTTVLDLHDPSTNQSVGQLIMRTNADGSVSLARLTGAAHFDYTRLVVLPLFADAKKRDEIAAALAASEAGAVDSVAPTAPLPFQQTQKLMRVALNPDNSADTENLSQISQAQATFFRDGSGFVSGMRAAVVVADAPKKTLAPALHIFGRYLSKLESDGLRLFRAKTVELAGDARLSFDDFETKLACSTPGHCGTVWSMTAPDVASSLHVMRRVNATVPRAPLDLISSMAPALPPSALTAPSLLTNQSPVTAVITPPSQPAVTTPPAQTTPSRSVPSQTVPQRDEIGSALQGSSAPQPGDH
ncbi:MAG: hypothetical protein HY243_11140 [Proteobacteria bacterium]|nr:hypothetical protein [Pseudomonadota bacterium]